MSKQKLLKEHIFYQECYMYDNEVINDLAHSYIEANDIDTDIDNLDDCLMYQYASETNQLDFEDFEIVLKDYLENHKLIAFADLGLWNGRYARYKFIDNINDFYSLLEDYNKIYSENGKLYINAIHHDSTNYFELRELTDKGIEMRDNDFYGNYTYKTYDTNFCTKKVCLAEKYFN